MDENLYPMIFKRKSFHLFKNTGSIRQEELSQIEDSFRRCKPLIPEIPVEMKIVPAAETTCKRGIMPADKVSWYNRIDIGIFLLFLEVCMEHEGLAFERTLFADPREKEKTLVAVYAVE